VRLIEKLYPEIKSEYSVSQKLQRWAGDLAVRVGLATIPEGDGPRCSEYEKKCRPAAIYYIGSMAADGSHVKAAVASKRERRWLDVEQFIALSKVLPPRANSGKNLEVQYQEQHFRLGVETVARDDVQRILCELEASAEASEGLNLNDARKALQPFQEWPAVEYVERRRRELLGPEATKVQATVSVHVE
jgi:hypothetical protein